MKIVIVVSSLGGGGAERAAGHLATAWIARGHNVQILTLLPPSPTDYPLGLHIRRMTLSVPRFETPPLRIVARLWALRRTLIAAAPDLVIAMQANMTIEVALATYRTSLRVIGCERNVPTRSVRGKLWQWLRPIAYRRLTRVVAQTRGAAKELATIASRTPISVVPNMVSLPLTSTGRQIAPRDVVATDKQVLLAVGRLIPAKGFDILIERFAAVAQDCPDLHLVILGEGPAREALTADIARLGMSDRIHLPGRAGNLATWYERADIFTMTSRWEGMPMVLIEAMAHGLPVVVTDFPYGPRDMILSRNEGIILPPLDDERWCDCISALYHDPAARQALGDAARIASTRFHPDVVLAQWDKVLTLSQS